MKITILSGKGGTGKTTVSNNLAVLVKESFLIDCDVEEPNSHIFMAPEITEEEEIRTGYPVVDEDKCIHCRKCADFCHYNAIIAGAAATMPLKDLCHDCGGCQLVCPAGAISYEKKGIGTIFSGTSRFGSRFLYGQLYTGELSGVKIINRLNEKMSHSDLVLVDSPPGTSCSTVAALEGSDYAVIVTEPTPFGVSDMKMVVEMLKEMNIPFSVVVNKAGLGDNEVYEYCSEENLTITGEIPFERIVAEAYASGKLAVEISEEHKSLYRNLWLNIQKEAERSHES
ncbi:ATP-binding protein [Spirochaeta isovalerica]|uniref:MinD superfamily P-loop ATPase n=1 Tax=Spirochaeta isovalerica TaxID=150 RepID=A0A841RFM3_9SPIO|nr:ATP-binding protein [Spirochaeta isovalerica]MBB6481790.1 MinD superfamily P-loop ATPase [Spirochaeta isovalerica]